MEGRSIGLNRRNYIPSWVANRRKIDSRSPYTSSVDLALKASTYEGELASKCPGIGCLSISKPAGRNVHDVTLALRRRVRASPGGPLGPLVSGRLV
jgi:hypothetical protein